jgi:hypothetical protein
MPLLYRGICDRTYERTRPIHWDRSAFLRALMGPRYQSTCRRPIAAFGPAVGSGRSGVPPFQEGQAPFASFGVKSATSFCRSLMKRRFPL